MPQRSTRFIVLALFMLVFFAGPSLIRFSTDWLWFSELGYQQLFFTMLRTQGILFSTAFVVSVVWLTLNLRMALTSVGDMRPVFTTKEGLEVALPGRQQLRAIAT